MYVNFAFAQVFSYISLGVILLVIVAANVIKRNHVKAAIKWLKKKFGIGRFYQNRPSRDPAARRKRFRRSSNRKYYFINTNNDEVDAAQDCVLTNSKVVEDCDLYEPKVENDLGSHSYGEDFKFCDDDNSSDLELGSQNVSEPHSSGADKVGEQKPKRDIERGNKTEVCNEQTDKTAELNQSHANEDVEAITVVKEDIKLSGEPSIKVSDTRLKKRPSMERPRGTFVSRSSSREIVESKDVFQIYLGDRAVYLYSCKDKVLGCELLCRFKADAVIRFHSPTDYTLLQYPPHPGLYGMNTKLYTVEDRTVERHCLMETGIITIEHNITGKKMQKQSVTIPLWGFHEDIDHYSMLLLHEKLNDISLKKPLEKLKIVVYCSESLYVSTVAMLESLECLEDFTRAAEVIDNIKAIHHLKISERNHNWVLDKLMASRKLGTERVTLNSFVASHPVSSLNTAFCQRVLDILHELVPNMDMSMCVLAVQYRNRGYNRRCTILPLDSERPYLGGPSVSPLECDYINASFIKGHLSAYEFVVTEWPLEHTIPLFWRLIHHYEISNIIVIGAHGALKRTRYPIFWPNGRSKNTYKSYGRYVVKRTSKHVVEQDMICKDSLQVIEARLGEVLEHDCDLHYIPQWPGMQQSIDDVFIDSIFQLVSKEWQRQRYGAQESTKLCVVSTDGAGKCGVVLGMWSILDQLFLSEPRVFDYMNTMRVLKLNRPMMLTSTDEIEILCKLIHQIYQQRHQFTASNISSKMAPSVLSLSSYKCAVAPLSADNDS